MSAEGYDYEIKAGSQEPALTVTLTDGPSATPTNLSGATVVMLIQPYGGGDPLPSLTLAAGGAGQASAEWGARLPPAGVYWVEFLVTQAGDTRRYPAAGYNTLAVYGNLGAAVP